MACLLYTSGGNTMVFNRAARELLRMAGDNVSVVAHDWWAYILILSLIHI